MHMTERDELMLQRCLDDELSAEETRQLMNRLNQIQDGWKTLACGFLHERAIARGVGQTATVRQPVHGSRPLRSREAASADFPERLHHWWSHPLTSLSLCASIAFVAGLLLPDFSQRGSSDAQLAAAAPEALTEGEPKISKIAANSGRSMEYRVQFHPDGGSVHRPVNIPVMRNMSEFREGLRRSSLQTERVLGQLPQPPSGFHNTDLSAAVVPLDDQHDVLIFVNDRILVQPVQ